MGAWEQFRERSPQLSPDNAFPAPDDQGLNAFAVGKGDGSAGRNGGKPGREEAGQTM